MKADWKMSKWPFSKMNPTTHGHYINMTTQATDTYATLISLLCVIKTMYLHEVYKQFAVFKIKVRKRKLVSTVWVFE